jgi:hypothetical protein
MCLNGKLQERALNYSCDSIPVILHIKKGVKIGKKSSSKQAPLPCSASAAKTSGILIAEYTMKE